MQLAKGDTNQWNQLENSRNKHIQLWHVNFGYRCKYNSIEKKIVFSINRTGKRDIAKQNKTHLILYNLKNSSYANCQK